MIALLLTTAAAWWMAAVAWIMQALTYPAFAEVPAERWSTHHARHSRAITPIVVPAMAVELVGALVVALAPPDGVSTALAVGGLVLALGAIAVTAAVAVPAHGRLASGYDPGTGRALLRANLVRALLWSAHAALCLVLLAQAG